MAKSLSLAELTALYANKGKPARSLSEFDPNHRAAKQLAATLLPGSNTADRISKLFYSRQ